jgi:hypothetical protein
MLGFTSHVLDPVNKLVRVAEAEDCKQVLTGSSFSAVAVARLLSGFVLSLAGEPSESGKLSNLWARWCNLETVARQKQNLLRRGWQAQHGANTSAASSHQGLSRDTLSTAQNLVAHYLQLADHRGSDVRLDAGLPYRLSAWPRAPIDAGQWTWKVKLSYKWSGESHINKLEAQALFDFLRSYIKNPTTHNSRMLFLLDSQAALGVLTKGRSSSKQLNSVMQRIAAVLRGCNIQPLFAWVPSDGNPADGPSRWAGRGRG